jgi:hypothetical protein
VIAGIVMLLVSLFLLAAFVAIALTLGPIVGPLLIVGLGWVLWYVFGDFLTGIVRRKRGPP